MDLAALTQRLSGGRIFHAYIVTGGDAALRERAGRLIAQAAVCSGPGPVPCGACRNCRKALRGVHEDIELITRGKGAKEHTVDTMRAVRARASVMPNGAARSVYIIADADTMNQAAQNAMLKVFEEPPPHAVFVLLADNPMRLLETVRSRCETVTLSPGELSGDGEALRRARLAVAAFITGDNLALVRALETVGALGRLEMPEYLDALRRAALERAGELSPEELCRLTGAADEAEKMDSVNISAAHIAGALLARLCRQ